MLKWIEIIASFFIGRMQSHEGPSLRESAIAIFDEITYKSRKAVSLIVVSFAAAIFALGGFFISLINATTQYDRDGVIGFTATFVSGLVLIVLAIAAFAWVFNSAWPGVKKYKTMHRHQESREFREQQEHVHAQPKQPSSLEQALSMLVMDFVHERQARRAESQSPLMNDEPDFRAPSMTRPNDSTSTVSENQNMDWNTPSAPRTAGVTNQDPLH